MKKCSTCEIEKEISEFNLNKWVKCGYDAACKICKRLEKKRYKDRNREKVLAEARKYAKRKYAENPEKFKKKYEEWTKNNPEIAKKCQRESAAKTYQKYKKERVEKARIYRENNREKIQEQRRKYKQDYKEYIKEKAKQYIERYPEKKRAVQAINNAIMCRKMVRPKHCSRCPSTENIEGHHPDYSKPLEVIWLCRKCHNKEHGK